MARLLTVSIALLGYITALAHGKQSHTRIDGNTLTFKWYDNVTPNKVNIATADRNVCPCKHLAEEIELYHQLKGTVKLGATNFSDEFSDSVAWTRTAGFVDTVFYGYQQHHNVIIRPDDIWTAIIVQFSLYVNANAEKLRDKFVNFYGKKNLVVKFHSRISQVDIREFIRQMIGLIEGNIDRNVSDWILPNFSTTTENDRLTAGVAMMATLQEYYDYEMWGIICGIPQVTILGTVDDWQNIRERVKRLKTFEVEGKTVMRQWSTMLGRILDEFVRVKNGIEPDMAFWKNAIRVDYKMVDLICASVNETTLNGWITAFSAFNLAGKWRGESETQFCFDDAPSLHYPKIRTDKITPGIVHVPIKIHDDYAEEGEREFTGAIMTGHMGYSVKRDEETIQPFSGWIMMITNNPPEYFRSKSPLTYG